jgi:transcriptional regulator with XRE-family HTH domain
MKITVSESDRETLEKWVKSRSVGEKRKQRAKIVLMSAEGMSTQELMRKLKVSNPTLNRWRRRYLEGGVAALEKGKSRPPGKAPLAPEKVQEVLALTLTGKPVGATHWSCRSMAEQVGVSKTTINRIWNSHQLKPHQVKGFKVSNDPRFEEKLRDVVGL